jgi:hypothetical protein
MNDRVNPSAPAPAPALSAPTTPVSRQSIKYGKAPIDPNASGRRARLRHPRKAAQGR